MTVLKTGATGAATIELQKALTAAGYDPGPVDGVFGPAVAAAVRRFQADAGLTVDGAYGPATAAALAAALAAAPAASAGSSAPASSPALSSPASSGACPTFSPAGAPLRERCLALTGAFETGAPPPRCFSGLTGDFDGQGLSFGALQWNFGQGTLQPLLQTMIERHEAVAAGVFGDGFAELRKTLTTADRPAQVAWAVGLQADGRTVGQPWRGRFVALGETPEFQAIETDAAATLYREALAYCRRFGLKSQRAAALMFDVATQEGSIGDAVARRIESDFAALSPGSGDADETPKLKIVANRCAEAANPRWVENVRARKLTIAEGGGVANGMHFDLAATYGITLDPAEDLA